MYPHTCVYVYVLSTNDKKIRGHEFERQENEGDTGDVRERRSRGFHI